MEFTKPRTNKNLSQKEEYSCKQGNGGAFMPDYGGAFDIDPNCYWTREDLDEFSGELEEYYMNKEGRRYFYVMNVYLKDDRIFDIDYRDASFDDEIYRLEKEISIDKRKAENAQELCEVYVPQVAEAIVGEIKDRNRDFIEMTEAEDIAADLERCNSEYEIAE